MDTKINSGNQYYLSIRHQVNQSWQGSLQRLDTGETINFRSEIELLHLIEEATDRQEDLNSDNQKLRKWKAAEKEDKQIFNTMKKNGTTRF